MHTNTSAGGERGGIRGDYGKRNAAPRRLFDPNWTFKDTMFGGRVGGASGRKLRGGSDEGQLSESSSSPIESDRKLLAFVNLHPTTNVDILIRERLCSNVSSRPPVSTPLI